VLFLKNAKIRAILQEIKLKNLFVLVCSTPPLADPNSATNPADITGQFLAGDAIDYQCNGALIPAAATTATCMDMGANPAVWMPATVPDCSKYNNNNYTVFLYLQRFDKK